MDSFLIEITKDILAYKDTDGKALVTKIRDSAGQVIIVLMNVRKKATAINTDVSKQSQKES